MNLHHSILSDGRSSDKYGDDHSIGSFVTLSWIRYPINVAKAGRKLIAIVGPPGAGKSTLSDLICEKLNESSPGIAAILPMDGFHFDDSILRDRGVLNRKGAPLSTVWYWLKKLSYHAT